MLEIIVTAGILSILAALSFAAFSNTFTHNALRTATEDVRTALLDARTRTLGSENEMNYGVHIATSSVVRFTGDEYAESSEDNVVFEFQGVVAVPMLAGNTNDVFFLRLSGEPSAAGTITLTDTRTGATSTVSVLPSGLIETEI